MQRSKKNPSAQAGAPQYNYAEVVFAEHVDNYGGNSDRFTLLIKTDQEMEVGGTYADGKFTGGKPTNEIAITIVGVLELNDLLAAFVRLDAARKEVRVCDAEGK